MCVAKFKCFTTIFKVLTRVSFVWRYFLIIDSVKISARIPSLSHLLAKTVRPYIHVCHHSHTICYVHEIKTFYGSVEPCSLHQVHMS